MKRQDEALDARRGPVLACLSGHVPAPTPPTSPRDNRRRSRWSGDAARHDQRRGLRARACLGVNLAENVHYRVWGKYFNRDHSFLPGGGPADDRWSATRGGFRVDWDASKNDLLTFQGDLYDGRIDNTYTFAIATPPFVQMASGHDTIRGGDLLARWTHTFSEDSDVQVQTYYDHTTRDLIVAGEKRDTFDVEMQHRFPLGRGHDIVWGGNYRLSSDEIAGSYLFMPGEASRNLQPVSGFVQDEITLVPDRLKLTLGSKFEHNDFTGFEIQPNASVLWSPHVKHSLWASVSRAVRTPSRAEENSQIHTPGPFPGSVVEILGNSAFRSEELIAYGVGYRTQPHPKVSLDLTLFYHDYDRLSATTVGAPILGLPILIPGVIVNGMRGETYGIEFAPSYQVTDWWHLHASYTMMRIQLHRDSPSIAASSEAAEGFSPKHQFSLRFSMNLPGGWTFDGIFRYVDALSGARVPSYLSLDLRAAWKPAPQWELAVVGQSLLQKHHAEFSSSSVIGAQGGEVQRGVYGSVTWRY